MYDFILNGLKESFYLSLGAVLGSWSRFLLVSYFLVDTCPRHLIIVAINLASAFLMGFLNSFHGISDLLNSSSHLYFILAIGFLGCFSTFSTFIFNVIELFQKNSIKNGVSLISVSVFGGIFAIALGSILGTFFI